MDEVLSRNIETLRGYPEVHMALYRAMIEADDNGIYGMDLYAQAVLHRSLMLTSGFCDLIEKNNYTCASPLVRLQLDNALRVFAGTLVDDPHDFALSVITKGERVDKIKDRTGERMRDWYLASKISDLYPWVKHIYDDASGFVHFSHKHFFNSTRLSESGKLEFLMPFEPHDAFTSKDQIDEVVFIFNESTHVVIDLVRNWVFTKRKAAEEAGNRDA